MASLANTLLARHGEEGLRDELKERLRAEGKITNEIGDDWPHGIMVILLVGHISIKGASCGYSLKSALLLF